MSDYSGMEPFAAGYRAGLTMAGKCAAYNVHSPPADKASRCARERGHTGKHDDLFGPPWGDREATGEDTVEDARRTWHDPQRMEATKVGDSDPKWVDFPAHVEGP